MQNPAIHWACVAALAAVVVLTAQQPGQLLPVPVEPTPQGETVQASYRLGPDDQLLIRALDAEEISDKPIRIDVSGFVRLPMVGRVRATGLTVEEFENELKDRLRVYIKDPQVAVMVTEFRSQPVSVIGAVSRPGIVQLEGRKTLVEVLSLAGGLTADAGYRVKITRRLEFGRIPLPSAADDPTAQYSVAEVELQSVMQARNPQENVLVQPFDVISVPRAELVYVMGQVKKAGGFVLRDRETMSVLQALSLAEGGWTGCRRRKRPRS